MRVRDRLRRLRRLPPPALLALIYLTFILFGTALLRLPLSHHGAVGWMEALFTSASAVTVTGLVVLDPGSDFTLFGQIVIVLLIQLGGLGLMTFAVLLLLAMGLSIGMPQRSILREELGQSSAHNLLWLSGLVLKFGIGCEIVGALLLMTVFVPDFGLAQGIWQSVFHAVSAFNNAGFSLFSDSLSGYVGNPVINIVIPLMFIFGGLGFVVLGDINRHRRWHKLMLHSKIMIAGTGALIATAFVLFAVLEWRNPGTLGGLGGPGARLWASWFQAVTPRTAGFNTLDTGAMHDATALMTISLMLIGGGSTSTAGGIKVTTFAVLILATLTFFRRGKTLRAFGRSIGLEQVMKVMALTTISILIVFVSIFLISLSHDGQFLLLAFEAASAFGTVGMSMGATGELDTLGRLVIIAVMFMGRVGPLTLGFFLATRSRPRVEYPPGQIYLG